jgi:glutamine amidotransferase
MKITVIDYGAGNLFSVVNSLRLVVPNCEIIISNSPEDLRSSDRIILPGVGAFADCIAGLNSVPGLIKEIKSQILVKKKPFLGICVGMQVLATVGFENGQHQGLGLINGEVKRIPESSEFKVPHMGWNNISVKNSHPILSEIADGEHFYFANSYRFICQDLNHVLAEVDYGVKINAVIAKDNIIAAQFHPEKSGEVGLRFLKNFLSF